jgi:hypothetical protein
VRRMIHGLLNRMAATEHSGLAVAEEAPRDA